MSPAIPIPLVGGANTSGQAEDGGPLKAASARLPSATRSRALTAAGVRSTRQPRRWQSRPGFRGGWPVNPQGQSAESVHAKADPASAGPGERARLSAVAGSLLDRRGDVCRREEPPRYESGLRAHGSNQRFHRLLGHAVARALTTAPSLTDLSPPAARILIPQGWRRKGAPGTLSLKGFGAGVSAGPLSGALMTDTA